MAVGNTSRSAHSRVNLRFWGYTLFSAMAISAFDLLSQIVPEGKAQPWAIFSLARTGTVFVLAIVICGLVFALAGREGAPAPLPRRRVLLAGFLIPLLSWSLLLACLWPGVSMNDTWAILSEPLAASSQHPLAYGYGLSALVHGGSLLLGNVSRGLAFAAMVQMVLWALVVAAMADTLRMNGAPRMVIYAFVAYTAAVPVVGDYAIALVKDSPFSIAIAAITVLLFRVWVSKGSAVGSRGFQIALFFSALAVTAMRNNGIALTVIMVPLLFFICDSNRKLAIGIVVAAIVAGSIPGQISKIYVGPHKYVESVSMPLQMIGYGIWAQPQCIPRAQRTYFSKIMPIAQWAQAYSPLSVDATKDNGQFDRDYLQRTKGEFARHFVAYSFSCPVSAAKGYLLHTRNYWSPQTRPIGRTSQSIFHSLVSNDSASSTAWRQELGKRGISNHSLLPDGLTSAVMAWFRTGTAHFPGAGTWAWALLVAVGGFLYRRRYAGLALAFPSALIYATLLVASPVSYPFRYVAFLALVAPFSLAILLVGEPAKQTINVGTTTKTPVNKSWW